MGKAGPPYIEQLVHVGHPLHLCRVCARRWTSPHFRDEEMEAQSSFLTCLLGSGTWKGGIEKGLWRTQADEKGGAGGCNCVSLIVGAVSLTLHLPVSTECSRRPEPSAWQHSPQRWDAWRPHPPGFLSGTCWALGWSCGPFTPGHSPAGGREGEGEE